MARSSSVFVAEAASYQVAWFVCGAFALGALAAIVTGRRMILQTAARSRRELSTRGR